MKLLLHVLFAFILVTHVSAQAPDTMQRVKTIRHFYATTPSNYGDSINFVYSGTHGSSFDPLVYNYYRGYIIAMNFGNYVVDLPEPFMNVYRMKTLYDTAVYFDVNNSSQPISPMKRYNVFSGDNIAAHYLRYVTGSKGTNKLFFDRDQQGRPLVIRGMLSDSTDSKHWDSAAQYVTYNPNGTVAIDSIIYAYNAKAIGVYSYNGKGDITVYENYQVDATGDSILQLRHIYSYNAAGKVDRRIYEQYNNGAAGPDTVMDQYVRYDTHGRLTRLLMKNKPSVMQPDSTIEFELRYKNDSSKLVDTLVNYSYDLGAMTHCVKTAFFYNRYGNPDSAVSYSFAGCVTFAAAEGKTYYTYELYTKEKEDTTVAPPSPKGKVVIFPNPARDVIKIRWNEEKPAAAYVYLYNSLGQLVGNTHMAKTQAEDSITLPGLAAGVYYIRITTGGGGRLYSGGITVQ